MPDFQHVMHAISAVIEAAGVGVIALGLLAATVRFAWPLAPREGRYMRYRHDVGRAILLGLEMLVAADIIDTVVVAPTLDNVLVLGGIVLIRTLLSLALQVELEGRWPWRRAPPPHGGEA